jgi:hypothetical protein
MIMDDIALNVAMLLVVRLPKQIELRKEESDVDSGAELRRLVRFGILNSGEIMNYPW